LHKAFNEKQEFDIALKPLTEKEVYKRQQYINVVFRNNKKVPMGKNIWKKRSVFFDLPYWSSLDVRHFFDVMHVEKNVCDSLIGILFNIKRNKKYIKKSREDMVVMGIQELAPKDIRNRAYFPLACHTLSKKEKKVFFIVCGVSKFPKGTHQM
jgi:hypothetical protein